jgi:hypothetical protein
MRFSIDPGYQISFKSVDKHRIRNMRKEGYTGDSSIAPKRYALYVKIRHGDRKISEKFNET